MKEIYCKKDIKNLKKYLRSKVIFAISALILGILCFVIFMLFITRENYLSLAIINGVLTSIFFFVSYGTLSIFIFPTNDEIKFNKMLNKDNDEVVKVNNFLVKEESISKYKLKFKIVEINDKEYLLLNEKVSELPTNVKNVVLNGKFVVSLRGDDNEK